MYTTSHHHTHARNIRRHNRRTYTYPAIRRAIGWVTLGVITAALVGALTVTITARTYTPADPGAGTDGRTNTRTVPAYTYGDQYYRSVTCPTEDSCARTWTGSMYNWFPQIP
jgi:hypothetical protein